MSTISPIIGLPIPDDGAPNDPPIHFQAFANVIDTVVTGRFATTSARDTAWSLWSAANSGAAVPNGARAWCDAPGAFYDRVGGAWQQRLPQTGLVIAGEMTTSQSSSTPTLARIVGGTNLTATLSTGRAYRWRWSCLGQADTAGEVLAVQAFGRSGASASTTDTLIATSSTPFTTTGGPGAKTLEFSDLFTVATSGTYTVSAFLARPAGSGVVTVNGRPRAEIVDEGVASALTGSFVQLS